MSKFKSSLSHRAGFSIVIALIGLSILSISIMAALLLMQSYSNSMAQVGLNVRLEAIRLLAVNQIQNDIAWSTSIQNVGNSSMVCLQTNADCTGQSGTFALYKSDGTLFFDSNTATNGFTVKGDLCASFDSVAGNDQCPIHLDLQWEPICPATSCINPPIKILGTFTVHAPKYSENVRRFNFELLRSKSTCDAQAPWTFSTTSGSLTTSSSSVIADSAALSYPMGVATSSILQSCNSNAVAFRHDHTYSGGGSMTDTTNAASVCFFAANTSGTPCIFEWAEEAGIWYLKSNGTVVYTSTLDAVGTSAATAIYQFQLNNGLMTFFYNYRRRFVFTNTFNLPMKVSFSPGSTSYAPFGFSSISVTVN